MRPSHNELDAQNSVHLLPSGVKKVTAETRNPSTRPTHSMQSVRTPNRHQAATRTMPPMLPAMAVRVRRTAQSREKTGLIGGSRPAPGFRHSILPGGSSSLSAGQAPRVLQRHQEPSTGRPSLGRGWFEPRKPAGELSLPGRGTGVLWHDL